MGIPKHASIAYYISAHGYGHGVRSCNIIRAVRKLNPQLNIHIVSDLPQSFLSNQIGSLPIEIRPKSFDVGMIQLDSIRVDVDATLEKIEQLYSQRKEIVDQEAAFLQEYGICLIVVDIPALPLEAASRIGIPRLAIANFGWDLIYADFVLRDPRWKSIVNIFREEYAQTDLLLRLPFCENMQAFPHIEDIPLVASPGKCRRPEINDVTGADPDKKWILLSFTTLDWDDAALNVVEQIREYEFFTVRPLHWQRKNIYSIDREQVAFSDVVASVDAVVSKPGFGIVSDCIVNRKPLIYADRTDFPEYSILKSAIGKYLQHIYIPSQNLYRGDLSYCLHNIWRCRPPVHHLPRGGDAIAAQRINKFAMMARGC